MLEDLPPEAWVLGGGEETVSPPGMGTMLSLEGLARLGRHVVRSYVDRAPVEVDLTFDWRASLPGLVRMQAAPQYWVWSAEGFDQESASRYFSGLAGNLADAFAGRTEGVADIRAVLERIEQLLPGTADGPAKTLMVAIYALWHRALAPSDHRPRAADLLAEHERRLQRAEMPSFVAGLLSNQLPEWTDDQWHALATERRAQRSRRHHLELPAGFDAALQVMVAERLMEARQSDEARTLACFAVEELPGNSPLIAWEAGLATGQASQLDLRALVLQLDPGATPQQEAPHCAGAPAAPPEPEAGEHEPGDLSSARAPVSGDEPRPTTSTRATTCNAGGEADSDDGQHAAAQNV